MKGGSGMKSSMTIDYHNESDNESDNESYSEHNEEDAKEKRRRDFNKSCQKLTRHLDRLYKAKKIIASLRDRNICNPVIGFPFKGGASLIDYSYETGVDCIALDWTIDLEWASKNINSEVVMQGNLDPAALIHDNPYLYKNVDFILSTMAEKRFIFNVGHGLTPECSIDNVRAVIKQVKNFKI